MRAVRMEDPVEEDRPLRRRTTKPVPRRNYRPEGTSDTLESHRSLGEAQVERLTVTGRVSVHLAGVKGVDVMATGPPRHVATVTDVRRSRPISRERRTFPPSSGFVPEKGDPLVSWHLRLDRHLTTSGTFGDGDGHETGPQ